MSNEYLLEYTRIKLRAALRDLSGGSKGQLEALCEHPPQTKTHTHANIFTVCSWRTGPLMLWLRQFTLWKVSADVAPRRR